MNPIENIWGIAKTQVARNNTSFKLDDVRNLIIDALNDITETVIRKTFEHAKKVESDYRKSDGLDVSPIQEKIVINAAAESSESSDSSLSDSSLSSQSDSLSDL